MPSLFSRSGDGVSVDVDASGPFFDGFAKRLAEGFRDIEAEVAADAVDQIRKRLDVVLVNPTGFYRSHIRAEPRGHGTIVTDSGVVYSTWLEGVSPRNRTTRFPGYHTFRRVFPEVDKRSPAVADRVLARYIS